MRKEQTSEDKFLSTLASVVGAGNGVAIIKTSEPDRVASVIYDGLDIWENSQKGLVNYKITKGTYVHDFESNGGGEELLYKAKTPTQGFVPVTDLPAILHAYENSADDKENPFYGYNFMLCNNVDSFLSQDIYKAFNVVEQKLIDLNSSLPYCTKIGDDEDVIGKRLFLIVPNGYKISEKLQSIPVITLDKPSVEEHKRTITDLFKKYEGEKPRYSDSDFQQIAINGAGLTEKGFISAAAGVIYDNSEELISLSATEFAELVGEQKINMVNNTPSLQIIDSVSVDQVGGLDNLKGYANELVSVMNTDARSQGIRAPRGCMLVGQGGTGKTLFARTISSILKIPLVKFNVSAVLGKYMGESEGQLREALDMIKSLGAAVILVDEAEKAFGSKVEGGGSVNSNMLELMLDAMQNNDNGSYWVFTANEPWLLPSPLVRRGRLDRVWSVAPPTPEERDQILRIHLEKRGRTVPDDLSLSVTASEGYVSAELEGAIEDSMIAAYSRTGDSNVTDEGIVAALKKIIPSSVMYADDCARMLDWGNKNALPASAPKSDESELVKGARPRGRKPTNKIIVKKKLTDDE